MKTITQILIAIIAASGLIGGVIAATKTTATKLPHCPPVQSVNDFMKNLTSFSKQYEKSSGSTGAYIIHMEDFNMVKKLSYSKIYLWLRNVKKATTKKPVLKIKIQQKANNIKGEKIKGEEIRVDSVTQNYFNTREPTCTYSFNSSNNKHRGPAIVTFMVEN